MERKYVIFAAAVIGVYVFMKFLSPVCSPFIFAFLIAGLLNRLTKKLPVKVKKSFFAGVILLMALVAILILLWLIGGVIFRKGGELAEQFSGCGTQLGGLLGNCCDFMESRFGIDAKAMETYVLEQVNIFVENMEVDILPAIMNKSVSYARNAAVAASFFVVMIIAVFLILKDYERIMETLKKDRGFHGVREVAGGVILYLKTYLKAQVTILLIISALCSGTLAVLKIKGGIVYGLVTGFMDTLPFIGTGIMLMPLAFLRLLDRNYFQAGAIVCLYAVCALLREFLEPKLIGSRVGIWPVGILFSVFAGVKLFGIFGIVKGPIGLVILCETGKYLFRTKEEPC